MTKVVLFFIVIIAANLPWFSEKFLYTIQLKTESKSLAWCVAELIIIYIAVVLIAIYAEFASYGGVAPQGWEFYSITACLFLVFTFPGFIYKVLWKK